MELMYVGSRKCFQYTPLRAEAAEDIAVKNYFHRSEKQWNKRPTILSHANSLVG